MAFLDASELQSIEIQTEPKYPARKTSAQSPYAGQHKKVLKKFFFHFFIFFFLKKKKKKKHMNFDHVRAKSIQGQFSLDYRLFDETAASTGYSAKDRMKTKRDKTHEGRRY
jgi:hypothetical protein